MSEKFITKIDEFRGLKNSPDGVSSLCNKDSSEMKNFKIVSGYKLKKRDGYKKKYTAEDNIRCADSITIGGEKKFYVLDGDTLYCGADLDTLHPISGTVSGSGKARFFLFDNSLYILTGVKIHKVSSSAVSELRGYIPTVSIETNGSGEGTLFEDVNLLSDSVRQEFIYDEDVSHYRLLIDGALSITEVKVGNSIVNEDDYYLDSIDNTLVLMNDPGVYTDPVLIVEYKIPAHPETAMINSSTCASLYAGANDSRAFLYGSESAPNVRFGTGIVDGKPRFDYFPVSGYTEIGNGNKITGVLSHYDRQLIFTEKEAFYSYAEYEIDQIGRRNAYFPVFPLSGSVGNSPIGEALLVENSPITLSNGSIYEWVATNVRDERNAKCISDSIAQFLISEDMKSAIMFNRKEKSELFIIFGNKIFVFNYVLNAFYYYEAFGIKGMFENDHDFYLYSDSFIAKVGGNDDDGAKIAAFWKSKKLDMGNISKKKNLSSISLSGNDSGEEVKLEITTDNNDSEAEIFEMQGEEENTLGIVNIRHRTKRRRAKLFQFTISCESKNDVMINEMALFGSVSEKN